VNSVKKIDEKEEEELVGEKIIVCPGDLITISKYEPDISFDVNSNMIKGNFITKFPSFLAIKHTCTHCAIEMGINKYMAAHPGAKPEELFSNFDLNFVHLNSWECLQEEKRTNLALAEDTSMMIERYIIEVFNSNTRTSITYTGKVSPTKHISRFQFLDYLTGRCYSTIKTLQPARI